MFSYFIIFHLCLTAFQQELGKLYTPGPNHQQAYGAPQRCAGTPPRWAWCFVCEIMAWDPASYPGSVGKLRVADMNKINERDRFPKKTLAYGGMRYVTNF